MLVSCLGDVMLDVVVDVPGGLVADDDVPARITLTPGGQAANVAAWVCSLGGSARVMGPRTASPAGKAVEETLARAGVELHGPFVEHTGTVVSLLSDGGRALASDSGSTGWLAEVSPGPWLAGADWLFVSGYALLRAPDPDRITAVATAARSGGARVAVDLAAASMIEAYGAAGFLRLWRSLRPSVVLAGDAEWAATQAGAGVGDVFGAGGTTVLVLKHGADGATFVIDGVGDRRSPDPGPVVDATGAGDALAAGYLVGGVDLAMSAAARCVAQVGAQPDEQHRAPS